MKWPKGKYNGKNITGVEVKVILDLSCWRLRILNQGCGSICVRIGPVRMWISAYYDYK